jgi:putative DNA primase/helicase
MTISTGPRGIFAENCRKYWDAGLPVIPLMTGQKRPCIDKWQTYANQMPSDAEQLVWQLQYAEGNIGLPLGPMSGLIAIDIDTDEPKILGVLDRVLPPSPWVRVGKKGNVKLYKFDGQPSIRIKHLSAETNKLESVVEMLSAGTQIVLPPSIHPETQRPYVANHELVSVLDQIRSLPPNIDILLRDALKEVGINVGAGGVGSLTNFVSPGSRDNTMMSMAGLFASDICRGHKTLIDACDQIKVWAENFSGKVYGDNLDPEKGPKKIVECLIKDVTGPKHKTLPKGWDDGLTPEQKDAMGLGIFTEDHETWNFEQIKTYFDAGLEKTGIRESDEGFMALAKDVIYKIAANNDLDNLEEGRLMRYIAEVSGKKVSLSEIRTMVSEYRSGEIKGTDHTEIAQAVLKDLNEIKGEIRYDNDKLWHWGGSHWKELDENIVTRRIAEEYGSYKAASRASDHYGIMRVMKGLCKKELKTLDENGINFVNGFVTEELEIKPHNPDHGMTYCLEYPYQPEQAGKCTKWLSMLHDYWGPDEDYADKVNALGESIAITMFGRAPSLDKVFCLYGVAHSGKSRILEIIQQLMPAEAQTSIPPTIWGDKFGTAPLANKLLNYAGELSETNFIDSAKFKAIVGGSLIEGQFKNQQMFNFRVKAAHWFATNHLPRTRDSSDGFTRRWLFLHFPRKFPENRKIPDYDKEVIAEERVAIAAWAVQYAVRLRAENWNLTIPPSSAEWVDKLENELNTVRAFLADLQEQGRLRLGVDAHQEIPEPVTTFENLWTEYRSFCVAGGVSPVSSKVLGKRLNSLQGIFGFTEERALNPSGFQQTRYRFLTFVKKGVKA